MKWLPLFTVIMCNVPALPVFWPDAASAAGPAQQLTHVSSTFHFTVNGPIRKAAPLFGPEGERVWAGEDWDPHFRFPVPAQDVQGAVFTIRHGEHSAVWVNTVFDPEGGRMQYVYVLADLLATTIDVRLHAIDAQHTRVDVTYARTALRAEANQHVAAMGRHDGEQGPEWQAAINSYLKSH